MFSKIRERKKIRDGTRIVSFPLRYQFFPEFIKGIATSLAYENYGEVQKKEFDEKFLLAQRPPRSMF
jgi:hypothetical protein